MLKLEFPLHLHQVNLSVHLYSGAGTVNVNTVPAEWRVLVYLDASLANISRAN